MCEAIQQNLLKKESALAVHFTSYFPCFLDMYKAHLCLLIHFLYAQHSRQVVQ